MMNDLLSEDTKAVLLLCAPLGQGQHERPLTITEYTSLVHWLIKEGMRPGDLLCKANLGKVATESSLDSGRLESLLSRGVKLGFAVEEWQRNGIWIISRSDVDYPIRYKRHLKDKAPPLLFGVGNRALLRGGGLGVVGSRNVDEEGAAFTRHVAATCANQEIPVVSGGARGVDQISMQTALEAGGTTIGILAEDLLKRSVERYARHAIATGRFLLISPYHPSAHFSVATAMSRNKLIYAMADYSLVVSAEYRKGGTWSGAVEELRREHPTPVFVRTGAQVPQGNNQLLNLGATPWPESIGCNSLKQQLSEIISEKITKVTVASMELRRLEGQRASSCESHQNQEQIDRHVNLAKPKGEWGRSTADIDDPIYNYVLFNHILPELDSPHNSKYLAENLKVTKAQMDEWLKKGIEEGYIEKITRPIRYKRKKAKAESYSLL